MQDVEVGLGPAKPGSDARRAGASEHEDDDGERRKLPRTVAVGAPLCWTLGAGLSGSAGPCTDHMVAMERLSESMCTTRALHTDFVSSPDLRERPSRTPLL